jgi:hypothetical protein
MNPDADVPMNDPRHPRKSAANVVIRGIRENPRRNVVIRGKCRDPRYPRKSAAKCRDPR